MKEESVRRNHPREKETSVAASRRTGTQAAAYRLLCSATPGAGGTAELESAVRRHTRPWRRTLEKRLDQRRRYMGERKKGLQ